MGIAAVVLVAALGKRQNRSRRSTLSGEATRIEALICSRDRSQH